MIYLLQHKYIFGSYLMGFFKERKRAKELEETYNLVVEFKKEVESLDPADPKLDFQSIYDKCGEVLRRIESAKVIVSEDLKKSVLANSWFATREALAYEYNIHKKRLAFLEKEEKEISSLRSVMLDKVVDREVAKRENANKTTKETPKEEPAPQEFGE